MTTPSHYHSHVDDPLSAGERLREARLAAGLSQRQLAFPGCSAAYISRLEAGQRVASLQLLRKIAARLGVDEEYLATGRSREIPRPTELVEAEVALRMHDLDAAAELYERVLHTASDVRFRAEALGGVGRLALERGDPRRAIDAIEEALSLAPTLPAATPGLVRSLGEAYAEAGELESAIGVFEKAAAAAAAAGNELEQARFELWLANAHVDRGDFGRAEQLLGGAIARTALKLDSAQRARLFWSQSRLHTLRGDRDAAARYARKALDSLELGEDTLDAARAHQLVASIALEQGRPEEALESVERGLALLGGEASPAEVARLRLQQARALALLARHEDAGAVARSVTALLDGAEPDDATRAYTVLGDVHRQLGDDAQAREIWELAVDRLEQQPNPYAGDVYERLGTLYDEQGQTEQALQMLELAAAVRQRVAAR